MSFIWNLICEWDYCQLNRAGEEKGWMLLNLECHSNVLKFQFWDSSPFFKGFASLDLLVSLFDRFQKKCRKLILSHFLCAWKVSYGCVISKFNFRYDINVDVHFNFHIFFSCSFNTFTRNADWKSQFCANHGRRWKTNDIIDVSFSTHRRLVIDSSRSKSFYDIIWTSRMWNCCRFDVSTSTGKIEISN